MRFILILVLFCYHFWHANSFLLCPPPHENSGLTPFPSPGHCFSTFEESKETSFFWHFDHMIALELLMFGGCCLFSKYRGVFLATTDEPVMVLHVGHDGTVVFVKLLHIFSFLLWNRKARVLSERLSLKNFGVITNFCCFSFLHWNCRIVQLINYRTVHVQFRLGIGIAKNWHPLSARSPAFMKNIFCLLFKWSRFVNETALELQKACGLYRNEIRSPCQQQQCFSTCEDHFVPWKEINDSVKRLNPTFTFCDLIISSNNKQLFCFTAISIDLINRSNLR